MDKMPRFKEQLFNYESLDSARLIGGATGAAAGGGDDLYLAPAFYFSVVFLRILPV